MNTSILTSEVTKITDWPPPYTLRRSNRIKRVTLSISLKNGLEIIIPDRLRRLPNIDNLLLERRSWIERNIVAYLSAKQQKLPLVKPFFLDLSAIQKVFTFTYQATSQQFIKIKPSSLLENAYQITGPIEKDDFVFKALKQWLKQMAKLHLTTWIKQLSEETNLYYSKISIRTQSSLWGSCTARKTINLNTKLLFLPTFLTRYILIHELCHLKHLNHSKRFWELVQIFDPDYLQHRKMMKKAESYVPPWVE